MKIKILFSFLVSVMLLSFTTSCGKDEVEQKSEQNGNQGGNQNGQGGQSGDDDDQGPQFPNDVVYIYTYVLNGQTYTSLDALNKALDELPAGSEGNTVYVVATPNDGGFAKTGKTTTFSTPKPGEKITIIIVVPGDPDKEISITLESPVES